MAKQRPDTLEDLAGISGVLRIRCRRCGRQVEYDAKTIVSYFRSRAWSTLLAHAGAHFRCDGDFGRRDGCGARDPEISARRPAPPPPPPPRPTLNSREVKEAIRRQRG